MAYAEKYNMAFKDALGANWVVSLRMLDYEGDVYTLIGGADPLQIVYDGDENNPYDPIRTCKATINFYVDENCGLLIDDLQDIDDATIFVDITSDTGQHASGFIVPDQTARGLSLQGGEISITTQDYYTISKGIYTYNGDGTLLTGVQNIDAYLNILFRSTTYNTYSQDDPPPPTIDMNVVTPYSVWPGTPPSGIGNTIFEQTGVAAEGFNTSNGRPDTTYNILQKLLQSFLSTSFWEGDKINVICPHGLDLTTYKTVYIKDTGTDSDFLIGDSEEVSTVRGASEVSAEIKFSTENGLLLNPFFAQWIDGLPDKWVCLQDSDRDSSGNPVGTPYYPIERKGNGRAISGAGIAVRCVWFDDWDEWGGTIYNGAYQLFGYPNNDALKGWAYTVQYNIQYTDFYTHWTDINKDDAHNAAFKPTIGVGIQFQGVSGKSYTYDTTSGSPKWTQIFPSPVPVINGGNGEAVGLGYDDLKELQSTDDEQQISIDLPVLPEPGYIAVALSSAAMDGDIFKIKNSRANMEDRTAVTYTSVILSTSGVPSGQTDYLTQVKNYTLKADTQDIYCNTGIASNIAGALYYYNGTDYLLLSPDTIYRHPETTPRTLLHQAVRAFMAMQRGARKVIDFDVYSNDIKFSDLIKFDDATGLSGVFMQLTRTYDVRACKQTIRAIEINPQFLDDIDSSTLDNDEIALYPTDTIDLYEHYNTVN